MKYKNLRVVFDLDEVGRRFVDKTIEVYKREHPGFKCPDIEDITTYEMRDFFDERADVYEFAFEKHVEEIYQLAPVEPEFKETLEFIKELGHTVIIATHNDGLRANATNIWLGANEIEFDELYFTSDKWIANGSIYFDDAAHNLENIKKHEQNKWEQSSKPYKIPSLYAYDKPWNQHWNGKRVFNMNQIRNIFNEELF